MQIVAIILLVSFVSNVSTSELQRRIHKKYYLKMLEAVMTLNKLELAYSQLSRPR